MLQAGLTGRGPVATRGGVDDVALLLVVDGVGIDLAVEPLPVQFAGIRLVTQRLANRLRIVELRL